MILDYGNLRVRLRNKTIWSTVLNKRAEDINYVFYAPLSAETGIKNMMNNGYDFTYNYNGSTETGEYVGGLLCCSSISLDLTQDWTVDFEYQYTGNLAKTDEYEDHTHLAPDWNIVFAFGTHIMDHSNADYPSYSIPVADSEPKTRGWEVWCSAPDVKSRHRYIIKYDSATKTTVVLIDNVEQKTAQFTYSKNERGFYLSGGGYEHSLPCKIKNFSIYGTLAV